MNDFEIAGLLALIGFIVVVLLVIAFPPAMIAAIMNAFGSSNILPVWLTIQAIWAAIVVYVIMTAS